MHNDFIAIPWSELFNELKFVGVKRVRLHQHKDYRWKFQPHLMEMWLSWFHHSPAAVWECTFAEKNCGPWRNNNRSGRYDLWVIAIGVTQASDGGHSKAWFLTMKQFHRCVSRDGRLSQSKCIPVLSIISKVIFSSFKSKTIRTFWKVLPLFV